MKVQGIGGLTAALLAVAFAFGGSHAVRAEDPEAAPSPDTVIGRIIHTMSEYGDRLAAAELTIDGFATALTTKQVNAQQLCVADESGARTCVTKAQLDALLMLSANLQASQQTPAEVATASPAEAAPAQSEPTAANETVAEHEPAGLPEDQEPTVAETSTEPAALGQKEEAVAAEPVVAEETKAARLDETSQETGQQLTQGKQADTNEAAGQEAAAQPAETAVAAPTEEHATVQAAVPAIEMPAASESHEVAAAPSSTTDEPEATGSIPQSAPGNTEATEATPPPAISAPETQPAAE